MYQEIDQNQSKYFLNVSVPVFLKNNSVNNNTENVLR